MHSEPEAFVGASAGRVLVCRLETDAHSTGEGCMRLDEFVRTNKVDILSCWRSSRHDAGLAMDEVAERDTMAAAGEELDVLCEFVRAQDRGDLALDLRDAAQSWISGTATGKSVEQMLREAMMLGRSVRRMVEEKNTEVSCCEIGMFYEGIQELLLVQLTRAIKTEQMESRQKRAEYLAFLGHELAAPLHTIRLMLGLLERGGDEAEKARATMTRATDRLLELVQSVVDFEWLTLEELPLRLERIRPCSVLDTILESVDFLAWQKGLRLVTRVERTLTMYVDPRLLHDALGNLIRNAVNYCESGTITIGIQEVG